MPATMKAWTLPAYNSDHAAAIASLTLSEIPKPTTLSPDQVLVKVAYASVNPIDWKLFSGGLDATVPVGPFPFTPGFDIAGTIELIGSNVTDVSVGDTVIANIGLVESCNGDVSQTAGGAFAQYAALPAALCASVQGVACDLKTLAGLPLAGLTSYQALFTGSAKSFTGTVLGEAGKGMKVLILGGTSATGLMAIQMAKAAGCSVAVTASKNAVAGGGTKIDLVKSYGADVVVDYKSEDWGTVLAGEGYDIIFDCVGDNDDLIVRAEKVLKKGGAFVSIANFDPALKSPESVRFANFFIKSSRQDLTALLDMIKKEELKVPIDREYKFSEAKEALSQSMGGRSVGKIIIKIEH